MAGLILEIVEGQEAGKQIPLSGPLDVGREGVQISLPNDTQVSRRHARVAPQNGVAVVEDLGSTNGTYVNEQEIHSPRQLSPGDRLRIGLTVFVIASISGGLAVEPGLLITSRVVQGIGASMLAPAGLSLLITAYPGEKERSRALGTYGAITSAGFASGAVLGGLLVEVSWRLVFFVNVPIGIALLAVLASGWRGDRQGGAVPCEPKTENARSKALPHFLRLEAGQMNSHGGIQCRIGVRRVDRG